MTFLIPYAGYIGTTALLAGGGAAAASSSASTSRAAKQAKDTRRKDAARESLVAEKDKSRKIRSALFKTGGGVLGEEVGEGGVGGRDTFFGN